MTPNLPSRYRVGREIGRGGMGVVYEADDERLGRKVAVKLLRLEAGDEDRKRRFEQEAKSASALNHPNIITIYDIDTTGGVQFIVMELVDGVPLTHVIRDGAMPVDRALDLSLQMASALAASHTANIVHRDLKPANVMITAAGRIKVLDFGLSKWHAAPDAMTAMGSPHTEAGVVVGTSGYMSPEQALGQVVDARSDVFSLGVVLYELLSGRRAFAGDSYVSVMNAVVHEQPAPLDAVRPDVPVALTKVVERCLAKDRTQRYPSAVELLDDLQRLATPAVAPRTSPTRRYLAWAAAVVGVLAIGGAWLAIRGWRTATMVERALPEIERLAEASQNMDAYRLAQRAISAAPDDPRVKRALLTFTAPLTMSEPVGADVYVKDYRDADGEWQLVGRVPLNDVRVPQGQMRWRIVKDGFDPAEGSGPTFPPVKIQRIGEAPAGMVYVPGGRAQIQQTSVMLPDFWIDKYEVTNREFRRFVDAGGYRDAKYWKEPFVIDGVTRSRSSGTRQDGRGLRRGKSEAIPKGAPTIP